MRVACLQYSTQVGQVNSNLNRADAILGSTSPGDLQALDLLVLPELAFSGVFLPYPHRARLHLDMRTTNGFEGYNFKSLQHISPFLEPAASGISSLWSRTTALKYNCTVVVGYPEKVDASVRWPTSPEYYNSAVIASCDGEAAGNYRKSFLYSIDETWALESKAGFFQSRFPALGKVAMGICMDIKFVLALLVPTAPRSPLLLTTAMQLVRIGLKHRGPPSNSPLTSGG